MITVKNNNVGITARKVRGVADLIRRKKVEEALKLTKNNSFQNAAILAAMSMAEELLLLKKKAYRELSRLEEKAILLIDEIDQANQSNQSQLAPPAQSNRQLRPGTTPGWN
jgi:ribosomal protein L22